MQKQNSEMFSVIKRQEGEKKEMVKKTVGIEKKSRSCLKEKEIFSYPFYLDLNISSWYI